MKKIPGSTTFLVILAFLFASIADAQPIQKGVTPVRNVFTFNLGQYFVNEINLGFERIFNERSGLEFSGGFIYRNDVILSMAKDWSNSQYFYERGFAARITHKTYRKSGSKSGKKSYYAFGLNYQYLYFNNQWFETDKEVKFSPDSSSSPITATEEIFRRRFRNRAGIQVTLGNIFPLGNTFAIEFFYGCGVRGILSERYDVARGVEIENEHFIIQTVNFRDQKFYVRPSIHAGVKLRIGW